MASVHAAFAPSAASRWIGVKLSAYRSSTCSPSQMFRPGASSGGAGIHNRQRLPTATACVEQPSAPDGATTRLYVSGLAFRTTEESLRNAFEKFGELTEVHIVMDRVARRPRGFAFLSYADEGEAKAAMEGMHGKFLDGRVIFVEVARRRYNSHLLQLKVLQASTSEPPAAGGNYKDAERKNGNISIELHMGR